MENIIKINKLGYNYGEGWILHDLSVEIAQGDFVAVIGPNGAGKSTLLRQLKTVLAPSGNTSGQILYRGVSLKDTDHRTQSQAFCSRLPAR